MLQLNFWHPVSGTVKLIAVSKVEPEGNAPFVYCCTQTRLLSQCKGNDPLASFVCKTVSERFCKFQQNALAFHSYCKFFRLQDKKKHLRDDPNVHNKNRHLASCHGSVLVNSSHSLVDATANFPCFSHLIFETHYKSC